MSFKRAIVNGHINKLYAEDGAAHDWYRFVLSFPPHLVRDFISRFGLNENTRILDPFCGTGTTLIESKKRGIESIGIESHPMMHFASQVKVDWSPNPQGLIEHAHKIAFIAARNLKMATATQKPIFTPLLDLIKNQEVVLETLTSEGFQLLLTNSISPLPLHKTLVLLNTIEALRNDHYYKHERLALSKALVSSIGNLRFGPEVGVSKPKSDAPVIESWLAGVEAIACDLYELQKFNETSAKVHHVDARSQHALESESIDACITSPPYPNEKDYTRTTRLETVLLGFISNKADLQSLKRGLVRSNTRTIYKGDTDNQWISNNAEVKSLAAEIEARRIELGKTSGFERLYARVTEHYFGGMTQHLANLRPYLRTGANLAYVVGDQASFFRILIRTGRILANIADSLGYEVVDTELFRSRLSTATKQKLREECIILRWRGSPNNKPKLVLQSLSETQQVIMPEEQETKTETNRYSQIIERVFNTHYKLGSKEVKFTRAEFETIAKELNINLPKNLGDIVYSFRYRVQLPKSIITTAPAGQHWIIRPAGKGIYVFALIAEFDMTPNPYYDKIKVPDATPGLVAKYSLNDEQALLAKLRYNRLIDIFTGITCYSLQNHLRTSIAGIGQVETDEIYVGVDKQGVHHVFPVQAKGGKDKLNVVQIEQDFALCASKFSNLVCHPIGAQFLADGSISLFEFKMSDEGVKISAEKHYKLVPPEEVTLQLLEDYKQNLAT